MLGSFKFSPIGSFIISGDTPEEFLWDLFDQIVGDGNKSVGADRVAITLNNKNGFSQDSQERIDARGGEEWVRTHSAYFCNKIASGSPIFAMIINKDHFFDFHVLSLIGSLLNESNDKAIIGMIKTNIALSNHGYNSDQFKEATRDIQWSDYPYPDTSPLSVINYLIFKQVLTVKMDGGYSLLTNADAKLLSVRREQEITRLREQQRDAAMQAKAREKLIGRKKSTKK